MTNMNLNQLQSEVEKEFEEKFVAKITSDNTKEVHKIIFLNDLPKIKDFILSTQQRTAEVIVGEVKKWAEKDIEVSKAFLNKKQALDEATDANQGYISGRLTFARDILFFLPDLLDKENLK